MNTYTTSSSATNTINEKQQKRLTYFDTPTARSSGSLYFRCATPLTYLYIWGKVGNELNEHDITHDFLHLQGRKMLTPTVIVSFS